MASNHTVKKRNRLHTIRKRRGVEVFELARRVDEPAKYITDYEYGIRTPSLPLAMKIAISLGCTVEDIWTVADWE